MLQFSAKYINNNYYCLFNVLVITIILIIDDIYKNNIFGQINAARQNRTTKTWYYFKFFAKIKKKCTLLLNSLDAASHNIMMLKNLFLINLK